MSSFAEWKWISPQDNADISQHIVLGPYMNQLRDHSEAIDAKNIWNHVVKNAVYDGTHWVDSCKLSIQHIIQMHKQYNNTISTTFPCFISASLSFLSLHNKPPLNLSWDPSFAGYSKRQIMLIFHLDSGRWSQVFGSSGVFRCNCAADGTWRAAADEGWGVEDFGKRGTPRPPPSRIHSVNESR